MSLYQLGDRIPDIDPSAFVHEHATLIGHVSVGAGVNIWLYATIRGDNEPITIGENSNVQECCVLHTDPGFPLTIAANVTVGHQACVHGCTIGEGSLVGIQAIAAPGALPPPYPAPVDAGNSRVGAARGGGPGHGGHPFGWRTGAKKIYERWHEAKRKARCHSARRRSLLAGIKSRIIRMGSRRK